jgi:hypothetical protein
VRARRASEAREPVRSVPLAACLLLLVACRFGGPGAPPESTAPPPADAAPDVAIAADADLAPADAITNTAPDASEPDGCAAPAPPAVCDPVCNTGCPAVSRCDVGEGTLTGACVGIWIGREGSACFKGSTTDACAPRLTCVGGLCRRLCYRDGDCAAGTCCTSPLPSGFKTCVACARP